MAKATLEDLKNRAQRAIDTGEDIIYDVAAETSQMVGNVKHMRWFKVAVMNALIGTYAKYSHLDEVTA